MVSAFLPLLLEDSAACQRFFSRMRANRDRTVDLRFQEHGIAGLEPRVRDPTLWQRDHIRGPAGQLKLPTFHSLTPSPFESMTYRVERIIHVDYIVVPKTPFDRDYSVGNRHRRTGFPSTSRKTRFEAGKKEGTKNGNTFGGHGAAQATIGRTESH